MENRIWKRTCSGFDLATQTFEFAFADVGHDIGLLAIDRLLDEHGLERFQRLDEQPGRLLTEGAVEIDGDVAFIAHCRAQFGE